MRALQRGQLLLVPAGHVGRCREPLQSLRAELARPIGPRKRVVNLGPRALRVRGPAVYGIVPPHAGIVAAQRRRVALGAREALA
jgi:hypothetical protein